MALTRRSKRIVIRFLLVAVPLVGLSFFWVRTHVWKAARPNAPDPASVGPSAETKRALIAQAKALVKPYRPVVPVDYVQVTYGPQGEKRATRYRAYFATQQLVAEDGRSLTAFPQALQAMVADIPQLEVSTDPDKPVWNVVRFRDSYLRFNAFRFRSPLEGPADLYWALASESQGLRWGILDFDDEGFQGRGEEHEVRFPRFRPPSASLYDWASFQSLTGGRIRPGRDYILWLLRPASQTDEQYEAKDREPEPADPEGAERRKKDLDALAKRLTDEYVMVHASIALRLIPAASEPQVSEASEVAERIGLPFDATPGSRIALRSPRAIAALRVTPDGRRIAVCNGGNAIRLHDLESGALVREFPLEGPCRTLEISPDGRLLLAVLERSTRIAAWDLTSGASLPAIDAARGAPAGLTGSAGAPEVAGLHFVDGSKRIAIHLRATQGTATVPGEVVVWDLESRREAERTALDAGTIAAFPFGEERLVVRPRLPPEGANRMELALVDRSGKGTARAGLGASSDIRLVSFSPGGTLVAYDVPSGAAFDFVIADWRTGETRTRFSTAVRETAGVATRARAVGWSPDGRFVAVALGNHTIQVWDVAQNRLARTAFGHQGEVRSLTFTADGRRLISGSDDGTVRTWPHDPSPPEAVTDSLGIELVPLPAADFLMGIPGSPFGGVGLGSGAERPRHTVRISRPFFIARHETTLGQFRAFVEATGYQTTAETNGIGGEHIVNANRGHVAQPDFIWKSPGFPQEENHPVVQVSYHDAQAFCRWLSTKERAVYRLPTEAEWEYACRAGAEGDTWNARMDGHYGRPADFYGNVADRSAQEHYSLLRDAASWKDGFVWSAPVGSFAPNGFGLYDMNGNVYEWCLDSFVKGFYETSPFVDPVSVEGSMNPEQKYVQRGGGFLHGEANSRCTFRDFGSRDQTQSSLGFRVVREFPAERSGSGKN